MRKRNVCSTLVKLSFIGLFCSPFITLAKTAPLADKYMVVAPDSIGTEIINDQIYIIHKVESKDTYYALGRRYKAQVNAIMSANNKKNLRPGDTVKIPTGRKGEALAVTKPVVNTTNTQKQNNTSVQTPDNNEILTSYKVGKSETLYAISRRFNTTVDEIKKLNNLTSNAVREGQMLKIPNADFQPPIIEEPVVAVEPEEIDTPIIEQPGRDLGFEPSRYGIREKKEKGIGVWMDNLETNEKSNLALHKTAPIGTILKITNPMTKSVTYAKVVGKFNDNADNQDAIVILSKSAASYIGALDRRFLIEIAYGVPLQE
ncbi:DPBB and LysM peptidoglycan-binding domain-containing protein [Sphingobacterium psychroaquaticum]|uniref:LysM repeat-containing protein n=1 Tax=Sphingobacterium psychroaquaticum TaxID=561061 RepID=A0A1X7JKH9_9SPHI|nr:LysM peptidoglycan-binding domain-containing protein [Sphingobacterium psychroaquaticum]SMG28353.1 LysM repeat-containing protein [Sphingobacterium psychroaquaticum]